MNNGELKKKIMDILHKDFIERLVTPVFVEKDGKETVLPKELCEIFNDITEQALIPYFADALISAGIGDVKEADHRAEVAERALEIACEKSNYCPNPPETIYNNDSECFETIDHCEYEIEDCASCRNRYFLKQAEKELEEEGI